MKKRTILKRDNEPYLIRTTLFACKWFSIKIHKALISDSDGPHDHPWNYLSLILWGGYWEERTTIKIHNRLDWDGSYDTWTDHIKSRVWYGPLSLLYRRGDQLHRLILPKGKYSISLIFTFRKWRKWGYIRDGAWQQYPHQQIYDHE